MPAAPLVEVTEGATTFRVPPRAPTRGPKARLDEPFYNPAMRLSRDVSVAVARVAAGERDRPLTICDAMASLGARGLRLAREAPNVHVLLNDVRLDSIHLAKQNLDRLGLTNVDFRMGRLETLLVDHRFDWVDLDPFGTPAPHLDLAAGAVHDGGVLAVTATDKATLSGVHPVVCRRRYGAWPLKGVLMAEVAARVLVGAVAHACGRRDRWIEPLLTQSTNHYVRTYVRVRDGAEAANRQAGAFAHLWIDGAKERHFTQRPPAAGAWGGPLWAEPIESAPFLEKVVAAAGDLPADTRKLLATLAAEASAPAFYYTTDEFLRGRPTAAPPMARILATLQAAGHVAVRTHFSPRAVKTDAPPEAFARALAT